MSSRECGFRLPVGRTGAPAGRVPWSRALLLLGSALALAGCATRVPQVLTPQILPSEFTSQEAPIWPRADWWQDFGSAELSELIQAAQANNRDLSAASARIMQAQAQTLIARSALFPQITLPGQAVRTRIGGASTATLPTGSTGNSFNLGAATSYGLDVWGLSRANVRVGQEASKAARFSRQALALGITANTARGYFNVLALRERIAILDGNIEAINGILNVINLRVSAGTSSRLGLAQEQAQLESALADLAILKQAELEARVSLAVLLGRPAQEFDIEARSPDGIRVPEVAPGLPSELLLRRPDVAEAEANLAAAHANLDAARAAFLPQFSLTGTAGYSSAALNTLLRGPSFIWSAGANLVGTIFDGRLIGEKRLAYAIQEELVAAYESAVLNAYADVEIALGQLRNYAEAVGHLRREVEAAREAFEISNLQYRQGTADLLGTLQAQQTLFFAQDELSQTQLAYMEAIVHLFEALGGGWVELPEDRTQFPPAG
jgi:multidrug efflux system outer membrane protein